MSKGLTVEKYNSSYRHVNSTKLREKFAKVSWAQTEDFFKGLARDSDICKKDFPIIKLSEKEMVSSHPSFALSVPGTLNS